jgi:hypothetical protein
LSAEQFLREARPFRVLAKASRLRELSHGIEVRRREDFSARELRELTRIKGKPPESGTPNPTTSICPNL